MKNYENVKFVSGKKWNTCKRCFTKTGWIGIISVYDKKENAVMKIFAYALRPYDEQIYFERFCREYGIEYGYTEAYPSMENADLAKGYEAITIITNPMYPEILDRFYSLGVRYIATRSIGYEHIDTEYARHLGMRISHVTYSPNSVANYTIMMMLMACRNMKYIMEKAALQDFSLRGKLGKELSLCTVGVIGTGKIGETLIRHLSSFGCRILAYDLYQKEAVKAYARYTDLEEIYRESDIITLHVPGSKENYHMIDKAAFARMKDGVILVNAARGMLVDTQAMIEALESGKLGYAALDTIEDEAGLYYLDREGDILKNRDMAVLKGFPNVMVSPHMAFYTEQAVSDMVGNAVKGLMGFMKEPDKENPFEVK